MKNKNLGVVAFWPLFFALIFLEAAVALLALLRIPAEGEGYSGSRWILIVLLLGILVSNAIFTFLSWRNSYIKKHWLDPSARPKLYGFLAIIFSLFATITGACAFILRWWNPERLLPFFTRLWPLLAYLILFSLQSSVWLLILRYGVRKVDFVARRPALGAFIILILILGFIQLTGLGVTPDPANPGEPGVPIQGWQLGLALILSIFFLPINFLPIFKSNSRYLDLLIAAFIWGLAAGIWLSVPNDVLKNSFYFPIDPPANIPLPYSDSGYYDYMAHSLLIGTDYIGQIPTRPVYIVFLTGLHLIFGENYNFIIYGQTAVLALIPVIFYKIGKILHSRIAGITIALLAIFREWTGLLVSSSTRVSNSKILLVDTPTLLIILLSILCAIHWLIRRDNRRALIAGGVFGVLLLLRTQSILIVPFLFLLAFLAMREIKHPWLPTTLIFLVGLLFTIAPWLTHNYLRLGTISFDAPFQYQVLASQYAYTGNLDFAAVDFENKSLSHILITFITKDPIFVLRFITNHFLTTEVGSVLALPLIFPFNGLREPINLYWTNLNGSFELQNILLILGYLAVIAVGFGAAWKRWRWIGLLPLGFNLGYAAANGIGRFSGWRYNLPADWVAYFYLGIGFAEILIWLAKILGANAYESRQMEIRDIPSKPQILNNWNVSLLITFTLIGSLPWIAKVINPTPKYANFDQTHLQSQILEVQPNTSRDEFQEFFKHPDAITLTGRLLYPRTFSKNTGLTSSTPWPSYAPRDYPRLGFKLLNFRSYEVVFPNKGVAIENVQGKEVIILGCKREDYVEARLLVFPEIDISYLSDRALKSCSE